MSDPRNVAHDKKVKQEKTHEKAAPLSGSEPSAEVAKTDEGPNEWERSVTVLSKLKEMEFHSRANIETLAELTLTIEDELKQKEFSDPIGGIYSAQSDFQSKIAELIESYAAKCESLKATA